jgi:hypothetical protein
VLGPGAPLDHCVGERRLAVRRHHGQIALGLVDESVMLELRVTTDGGPFMTPHTLRRTFASILAVCDVPPRRAMYLMGHTDPSLTLAVYQQVLDMGKGSIDWLAGILDCTLANPRDLQRRAERARVTRGSCLLFHVGNTGCPEALGGARRCSASRVSSDGTSGTLRSPASVFVPALGMRSRPALRSTCGRPDRSAPKRAVR